MTKKKVAAQKTDGNGTTGTKKRASKKAVKKRESPSRLKIVETRIIKRSMITNAPYNPRRITAAARRKLRKSIERFGLVQDPVWNEKTGHLVGGHQRIDQCDSLSDTPDYEIPVKVVSLSEAAERELNVVLNNQNAQGHYDEELLFDLLSDESVPINLENTGFERIDIELLAEDLGEQSPMFDAMLGGREALDTAIGDIQETLEDIEEARRVAKDKADQQADDDDDGLDDDGDNDSDNDQDDEAARDAAFKKAKKEFSERAVIDYEGNFFIVVVFPSDAMRRAFSDAIGSPQTDYVSFDEIRDAILPEVLEKIPDAAELEEPAV